MLKSGMVAMALVLGSVATTFAQDTWSNAHWISITWGDHTPAGTGLNWGGNFDQISNALLVERQTWYREAGTTTWIGTSVLSGSGGPTYPWTAGVSSTGIPRDRDIELYARVRWYNGTQWFFNDASGWIWGE